LSSILNVAGESVKSGGFVFVWAIGNCWSCDAARAAVEERRFSAAFPAPQSEWPLGPQSTRAEARLLPGDRGRGP